jgi:hypothetical protein
MTACERATAILDTRWRAAEAVRARSTAASDCGTAIAERTAMSVMANRSSMKV